MNLIEQLKQKDNLALHLNLFVYAAALENGFTPSTLVLDAPFVMDQGEGLKTWKPENYGKNFMVLQL